MVVRKRVYSKTRSKRAKLNYQKPSSASHHAVSTSKGIGNRVDSNFIYFDTLSLDPAAGGAAVNYLFRINSLFDPDFNFGGHQPAGFDELMAIYEHYCVTDVEYKVVFYNTNSAQVGALVGTCVSDNSSTSSTFGLMIENGNAQYSVCGPAAGSGVKTLKGTVDISKLMGVTRKQLLADDSFWGSQGANPSDPAFLKVIVGPAQAGSDGPRVDISVELKFKAVLMGGRFVQQS